MVDAADSDLLWVYIRRSRAPHNLDPLRKKRRCSEKEKVAQLHWGCLSGSWFLRWRLKLNPITCSLMYTMHSDVIWKAIHVAVLPHFCVRDLKWQERLVFWQLYLFLSVKCYSKHHIGASSCFFFYFWQPITCCYSLFARGIWLYKVTVYIACAMWPFSADSLLGWQTHSCSMSSHQIRQRVFNFWLQPLMVSSSTMPFSLCLLTWEARVQTVQPFKQD